MSRYEVTWTEVVHFSAVFELDEDLPPDATQFHGDPEDHAYGDPADPATQMASTLQDMVTGSYEASEHSELVGERTVTSVRPL